jgi:hypothetical protein
LNQAVEIVSTANQDNPSWESDPVLKADRSLVRCLEHAYYLKYQNRRADYLKAFWNVVNWAEVSKLPMPLVNKSLKRKWHARKGCHFSVLLNSFLAEPLLLCQRRRYCFSRASPCSCRLSYLAIQEVSHRNAYSDTEFVLPTLPPKYCGQDIFFCSMNF